MAHRFLQLIVTLIGVALTLAMAFVLESATGISVAVTLRIIVAGVCLFVMFKIGGDYPGEKWPKIALAIAAIFNFAMFFSPLAKMPVSKGDLMFFAVPDAVIFLAFRTFTYPVTDIHTRAVRQQLIVGLILALAFCAIIMSILLAP